MKNYHFGIRHFPINYLFILFDNFYFLINCLVFEHFLSYFINRLKKQKKKNKVGIILVY